MRIFDDPRIGFKTLIKERREELGISQRDLAKLVCISTGYIARIESCYSQPPAEDKVGGGA